MLVKLCKRFIDFGFYCVSQFCILLDTPFSKEAGLDYQKNTWPIKKLVPLIPNGSLPEQVEEES